jgi:hypothetical protein
MGGGMGEMRLHKNYLKTLKRRDHLKDLGVDGKIILEWISEKWGGMGIGTGDVLLRT